MGNCVRRLAVWLSKEMTMFGADASVEHEIENSRKHWSELTQTGTELSEDDDHEDEEVTRKNREVFAKLMNDPQWKHHGRSFFLKCPPEMSLGRKIAEGGQAAIFEVINEARKVYYKDVLFKVFKRGSCLSDLQRQWPHGILQHEVPECIAFAGTLLDDGRFAFVMKRCWGDLRKLINQAMREKNIQGPPFPYEWNGETLDVHYILTSIALNMESLHEKGIIHKDLKAANILLMKEEDRGSCTFPTVADYECSVEVIGTGFWRAPEILLALREGGDPLFNEKVDVYSFGMTCFEVVTGRMPFEGELEVSRDLVIAGRRPELPRDLDEPLRDLIESCWNPSPNERPSFEEIVHKFASFN